MGTRLRALSKILVFVVCSGGGGGHYIGSHLLVHHMYLCSNSSHCRLRAVNGFLNLVCGYEVLDLCGGVALPCNMIGSLSFKGSVQCVKSRGR